LRIGVNTGEPHVRAGRTRRPSRADRAGRRRQHRVTAPDVCTAAGFSSARRRGATRRSIRYEVVEPFVVKGKEEPSMPGSRRAARFDAHRAAAVVGSDGGPQRRPGGADDGVGRVVEDRRSHFVVVLGRPGSGRAGSVVAAPRQESRLAVAVFRGRSLSYGESTGYGALASVVRQAAGIFETDRASDAREKPPSGCARSRRPRPRTSSRQLPSSRTERW
jgi:hypothetical protein